MVGMIPLMNPGTVFSISSIVRSPTSWIDLLLLSSNFMIPSSLKNQVPRPNDDFGVFGTGVRYWVLKISRGDLLWVLARFDEFVYSNPPFFYTSSSSCDPNRSPPNSSAMIRSTWQVARIITIRWSQSWRWRMGRRIRRRGDGREGRGRGEEFSSPSDGFSKPESYPLAYSFYFSFLNWESSEGTVFCILWSRCSILSECTFSSKEMQDCSSWSNVVVRPEGGHILESRCHSFVWLLLSIILIEY